MDAHEDTPRIQILSVSDTGRRRRWADGEKVRIVEESHRDGVTHMWPSPDGYKYSRAISHSLTAKYVANPMP